MGPLKVEAYILESGIDEDFNTVHTKLKQICPNDLMTVAVTADISAPEATDAADAARDDDDDDDDDDEAGPVEEQWYLVVGWADFDVLGEVKRHRIPLKRKGGGKSKSGVKGAAEFEPMEVKLQCPPRTGKFNVHVSLTSANYVGLTQAVAHQVTIEEERPDDDDDE
jgi:hypothetical protein